MEEVLSLINYLTKQMNKTNDNLTYHMELTLQLTKEVQILRKELDALKVEVKHPNPY